MKVEIFRLAGEPIQVEVQDGGTVTVTLFL